MENANSSALRSVNPATLWTLNDDHNLMIALSKIIHHRPIPWNLVIDEFPHRPQAEVLKRINHCLQDIQRDLLAKAVQLSTEVPAVPNQQIVHKQHHASSSSSSIKRKRQAQAHNTDQEQRRKKRSEPVPWLPEDQSNFQRGIKEHGWGKWKEIQASFLQNKTVAQITSHAQRQLKKTKGTNIQNEIQNEGGDVSKAKKKTNIQDEGSDVSDCRETPITTSDRDDLSNRDDDLLELRMC